jgi:hypothetical protein
MTDSKRERGGVAGESGGILFAGGGERRRFRCPHWGEGELREPVGGRGRVAWTLQREKTIRLVFREKRGEEVVLRHREGTGCMRPHPREVNEAYGSRRTTTSSNPAKLANHTARAR